MIISKYLLIHTQHQARADHVFSIQLIASTLTIREEDSEKQLVFLTIMNSLLES